MSRIGILPVKLPEGVTASMDNKVIKIKGPLGALQQEINEEIKVEIDNDQIVLKRPTDQKRHKSIHGLYRSLVYNMVEGVSEGYTIKQELVGVGFKAEAKGQRLELNLGFAHDVIIELPPEIKVETKTERRKNPIITLKSPDKQLIGQVAAKIRSIYPPEPYKGKGIKYVGEQIRKKAGKAASVSL